MLDRASELLDKDVRTGEITSVSEVMRVYSKAIEKNIDQLDDEVVLDRAGDILREIYSYSYDSKTISEEEHFDLVSSFVEKNINFASDDVLIDAATQLLYDNGKGDSTLNPNLGTMDKEEYFVDLNKYIDYYNSVYEEVMEVL